MRSFILSKEADDDVQDIYWYSVDQWGEQQAKSYIEYLFNTFSLLTERPQIGRLRPDIRPGVRSFLAKAHVVLFVETASGIGIARILHTAMDIEHAPLGKPFPDQTET